jgi:hypothetical protein
MRYARFLPFIAVAAIALVLSFPPPQHPKPITLFPDSVTYLQWSHGRPPTPSLFYALVGSGRARRMSVALLRLWTMAKLPSR